MEIKDKTTGLRFSSKMVQVILDCLDIVHRNSEYILLRQFQQFPHFSGFDIDVLVKDNLVGIQRDIRAYSNKVGLLCSFYSKKNSLKVMLVDISSLFTNGIRTWVIFDLTLQVKIGLERLRYKDIVNRYGINYLHFGNVNYTVASSRLLDEFAKRKRMARERKQDCRKFGLRRKIFRFMFEECFFIRRKVYTSHFFVISGADGVGKTTVGNEIIQLFKNFPLSVRFAHHISEWKRKHKVRTIVSKKPFWKRMIPYPIKYVKSVFLAELKYFREINKMLYESYCRGEILLLDRYIYDRIIKMKYFQKKTFIQKFIADTLSLFARYPAFTFFLSATPEIIYLRKQELTKENISFYQQAMRGFLKGRGVRFVEINVDGKFPVNIAKEINKVLIKQLTPKLVFYAFSWEKLRK